MKAYAVDLRERVVAAVEAGMSKPEVAKVFGVSIPTIYRYLRLREEREDGKLDPKAITGRPSRKGAALDAGLLLQLEANKDATLGEHCALWEERFGMKVSTATMSRAIKRVGWTLKKSL